MGYHKAVVTLALVVGAVGLTGVPEASAAPPPLSVTASPTPVAFGNVNIVDTGRKRITVTNTSDVNEQIFSTLSGAMEFAEEPIPPVPSGACDLPAGSATVYLVLSPGDQCWVDISFAPTTAGARAGEVSLEIMRHAGGAGQYLSTESAPEASRSINLTGKGVAPPFTVTPTSHAFGNVTVGQSRQTTLVVKNTSTGRLAFWPAEPTDPSFTWSGAPSDSCVETDFFGTQRPAHVDVGDSCSLVVSFSREEVGSAKAQLVVGAYHPGAGELGGPSGPRLSSKVVGLTGVAVAPTATVTPTSLPFGNVTVGAVASKTVTVKNTSDVSVQFWPRSPSESPFSLSSTGGPAACATYSLPSGVLVPVDVTPGGSCTLQAEFYAGALGHRTADLTVDIYRHGDQAGPSGPKLASKTISASGTGVAPTFTVARTPVAFGNVTAGASASRVLTVTNTSQVPLSFDPSTVSGSAFSGDPNGPDEGCADYSDFAPVDVYATVAPGDSCTLLVSFYPSEPGATSGAMAVSAYAPVDPLGAFGPVLASKTFRVSGTGKAPTIAVAPGSLSFGSVDLNQSKSRDVTVTNTSGVTLEIFPSGSAGSAFQSSTGAGSSPCGTVTPFGTTNPVPIGPGQSCVIQVIFYPTSSGYQSGKVIVDAYGGHTELGYPSGPVLATAVVRATGSGKPV